MTVRIATMDELEDCLDVRREVFVEGQDVPLELEVDGLDEACTHFVARDPAGRAIATARLRITDEGTAKAERVAVRAEARGRGLGDALMAALEAEAARLGHSEVVLGAQVAVLGFYETRGYLAEGPEFMDAGIPHRKMRLSLGGDR